jgi:hypothetical protein
MTPLELANTRPPPTDTAIIFNSDVERVGGNADLFWLECVVGQDVRRVEFFVQHPDADIQKAGRQVLHLLVASCGMSGVDDSSDFLNKEFNPKLLDRIDAILAAAQPHSATTEGKYVYVISCVGSEPPLCKIGIANSPEKRVKQLATASPHGLRLEMARYFDNARQVEAAAHRRFGGRRQNGEWFAAHAKEAIQFLSTFGAN